MEIKYIKIKDLEIPISIKSYRNSKSIKIFFKGNILTVTKPTRLSTKRLVETIKSNEEDIYDKMFDDWSNLEHYDILTIEPGKNYCIYAIYGAPYWCVESESVKGYIEWAKGHREEFENSDARIAEIRVKEEPIVEEEPTVQESVKYESTIPVAKPSLKSKLGWVGPAGVIGVLGAAVLIFIKRRK